MILARLEVSDPRRYVRASKLEIVLPGSAGEQLTTMPGHQNIIIYAADEGVSTVRSNDQLPGLRMFRLAP